MNIARWRNLFFRHSLFAWFLVAGLLYLPVTHAQSFPYPPDCSAAGGSYTCVASTLSPFLYTGVGIDACNNGAPAFSNEGDAIHTWEAWAKQHLGACDFQDGGYFPLPTASRLEGCGTSTYAPVVDTAGRATFNLHHFGWSLCKGGNQSDNPISMQRYTICPAGYQAYYSICRAGNFADLAKQLGKSCPTCGNPITPAIGNKFQEETDYRGTDAFPLTITRYYNSSLDMDETIPGAVGFYGTGATGGTTFAQEFGGDSYLTSLPLTSNDPRLVNLGLSLIGTNWRHYYQRSLYFQSITDPEGHFTLSSFTAYRPDGKVYVFNSYNGAWVADKDVNLRIVEAPPGYHLITEEGEVEQYDSSGRLLSISNRAGITHTLQYDTCNRLASVTHSFGQQLTFNYNASCDTPGANAKVHSISLPDSSSVSYGYATDGTLTSVTYPDSTTRIYQYNGESLTALIDESNVQYASWGYDSSGLARSSQHAGGANATTVSYTPCSSCNRWQISSALVTDELNTQRTYGFILNNHVSRLQFLTQPAANGSGTVTESYAYDGNGNVSSHADFNGITTVYKYDLTRNLETSRTEANGTARARMITTQWNATYRLPALISVYAGGSATGTPLRTTSFTYDSSGNFLTKTITDPSVTPNISRTWTYTYNAYGQVLNADGPRTDVSDLTTYTYYSCTSGYQCGQLHTVTNAAGQITTYNTYNAHGQPLTITDANGVVTTLTYDTRQRLTSRQVGSETTTFGYWPTGLLKKVTLPDASYLLYSYDNAHRLTQISDGLGNSINYTLDVQGNRTAENLYDPSNTLHRTHTRVFNALSQLYKDVNAAGTAAVTTTFGYDNNGNQTSIAAPLARNTGNAYDELNRLQQITDPASGLTKFAYDANDNLTSVTDPRNRVTSYGYNGLGDQVTLASPDTGTTSTTYDSGGNLATSTDARGALSTYGYDVLNRLTSVAYSQGGSTDQTISFTYDAGSNGKSHLTGASDANHSLTWQYDSLGRTAGKIQIVGSVTLSAAYTYTDGNLTQLTTPSGQQIGFSYSNHQVSGVTVNGTTVLSGVTYDPFGPASRWAWGNGTQEIRLYDTDGNPSQFSAIESSSYVLDDAFRVQSISNASNSALSWNYGYDALDRLTSANSSSKSLSWTYDANGNRLSLSGAAALTSPVTLAYNDRGRMISATASGATTSYVYNALGQRIEKRGTAGTVLFFYDEGGHLLGEYDGAGHLIEETVWLGDIPIATLRSSGGSGISLYYVHADHLNTPRMITRPADNTVMWRWDTDPFGTTPVNQNPTGLGVFAYNLRLPGQYYDAETGLNYNGFRDYDSAIGRYVKSDSLGLRGGLNTYAYAVDSPMMFIDPSGLAPWDWDGIGDTSLCEYYEQQSRSTKCPYYDQAAKACRGRRADIKALLTLGIAQAWITNRTTASESQIYDTIRRGLIRYDQYTQSSSSTGCGGDCPRGDWIDLYHNIVFESAGISSFFYGGNVVPQGVWPNFVPYDAHGKPSWDPRRLFN